MIGYYIHHVGVGHLHRARGRPAPSRTGHGAVVPAARRSLARALGDPPRDDANSAPRDPTAGGALHWAPLHDSGFRDRMALIAAWIAAHGPSVVVVDLSAEVLMLARLMGTPVVAVSLPGVRDDAAHQHGYELADAIVAPWPVGHRSIGPSLRRFRAKTHYVGAISRFESVADAAAVDVSDWVAPGQSAAAGRVLVLSGLGDAASTDGSSIPELPGWEQLTIGAGNWNPDPWNDIREADVVVTHAGLGALADVAIARRPAVVVPQPRPHQEQVSTASALGRSGLAVVARSPVIGPAPWLSLLSEARRIGGERWPEWADGHGGERMARVVLNVASR